MRKYHVVMIFLLGYLMLSAGMVWQFGQYGLMGSGAVLAILALITVDVERGGGDG